MIEVQHLLRLIERNQFDTIYHEHYCYYTLLAMQRLLAAHGLTVFDVEEIPTHGGSIRVYARHAENDSHADPAARWRICWRWNAPRACTNWRATMASRKKSCRPSTACSIS